MTSVRTIRTINAGLLFLSIAAVIYAVEIALVPHLARVEDAGRLATAMAIDLLVVVPVLWYTLVVRRLGWPWLSVVPVAVLSLMAARGVIPEAHHGALGAFELLLIPAEIALVAYVAWHAVRAVREACGAGRHADDALVSIRAAARRVVPAPRAAELIASELAIFHYALGSWRSPVPDGDHDFSTHERSTYGSVLLGLVLLTAIELVPVHLLIARWSGVVAWIFTALSAYGLIWFVADFRATRLRTVRVTPEALHLRAGLRWDVSIPFDDVRSIERAGAGDPPGGTPLAIAMFADPNVLVRTTRPVTVRGMYGMTRKTEEIALSVDDPARFVEACRRMGVPEPDGTGARGS